MKIFINCCKTLTTRRLGSFPALNQLNGDEFVTLVKSQSTKETLTVVFVENSLSVEDLSQCRLKTETCFANLRKIQQKTYLTAVDDPVEALKASYGEQSQNSISISSEDDLSEKVDAAGGEKLLFVYLDSVESNEDFANHGESLHNQPFAGHTILNVLIKTRWADEPVLHRTCIETWKCHCYLHRSSSVLCKLCKYHSPTFSMTFLLTDSLPKVYSKPLIRKTRQTPEVEANVTKHFVNVENRVLIAFNNLKILGVDQPFEALTFRLNETTDDLKAHLIQLNIVSGQHTVGIELFLSAGTWYANRLYLGGKRFHPSHPVSAYLGKSFGCVNVTATDGRDHFSLEGVQIQPEFGIETNLTRFSDRHNDCTGFFSAAIWGALFVMIILAMILSCGLTAIMDIKTMDRFDDPKGKTITINAQE